MADAGFLELEDGTQPPSGGSGTYRLFVDQADGHLKKRGPSGPVVDIENPGGVQNAVDTPLVPAGDIESINVEDAIYELDAEKAPISHVGAGGVSEHPVATGSVAGFLSPSDFTKLGTVATGATANDTDANLKNRANHTGSQAASTISDFDSAADARAAIGDAAHVAALDPHPQYATDSDLSSGLALKYNASNPSNYVDASGAAAAAPVQSVAGKTGVVTLNSADVGLGSVDNTSDLSKPVSVAQAAADAAVQAYAIQRANHTGSQTSSTISDFASAVAALITGKVSKTGDSMSGALVMSDGSGNGYTEYAAQGTTPSAPSNGVRVYSGATGRLAWKNAASGTACAFDSTAHTGTRIVTIPDASGTMMYDPMTTIGDLIHRNASNVTSRLGVGLTNQVLRVLSGVPSWDYETVPNFGDGSDLNSTLTGSFTATQNLFYNTLTISGAGSLNLGNYFLCCNTLDLSNAGANAITFTGANGNNSTGTSGGTAGGTTAAGFYSVTANGSGGGASSTTTGATAGAPTAQNPSNGGSGGALRAGASASNFTKLGIPTVYFQRNGSTILSGAGGGGGGGGGGNGAAAGTGGGAGGSGGGFAVIFCKTLITSGSTATGAISSKGGAGGNSAAATNANAGSGGGGGGGGGGTIYLFYGSKSGASVSSLIDASGGNGGNSGNANGTGLAGNAGQGGDGGRILAMNLTTMSSTYVTGSAGTAGGSGSGATGATGGAGGSCVLTL